MLALQVTSVLSCLILALEVASGGRLLGTYSPLQPPLLNVNEINPQTGLPTNLIFTSSEYYQFFAITPAFDPSNRRIFIPAFSSQHVSSILPERVSHSVEDQMHPDQMRSRFDEMEIASKLFERLPPTFKNKADEPLPYGLLILQLSPDEKNITIVGEAALPPTFPLCIQYDTVTGFVYLLSTVWKGAENDTNPPPVYFGAVDVQNNKYLNLTDLPPSYYPSMYDFGGAPSILDSKRRTFAVPTLDRNDQQKFFLTFINLESLHINHFPQRDYNIISMILDPNNYESYGLLSPLPLHHGQLRNLTWGMVDINSGVISPIHKWDRPDLVFVVGSLAAIDGQQGKFYSILGTGQSMQVSLVTVDVNTGQLLNVARLDSSRPQPRSLLVIIS